MLWVQGFEIESQNGRVGRGPQGHRVQPPVHCRNLAQSIPDRSMLLETQLLPLQPSQFKTASEGGILKAGCDVYELSILKFKKAMRLNNCTMFQCFSPSTNITWRLLEKYRNGNNYPEKPFNLLSWCGVFSRHGHYLTVVVLELVNLYVFPVCIQLFYYSEVIAMLLCFFCLCIIQFLHL